MVVPGSVKPCSGPTTWTMPWRLSRSLKYSMPKSRALALRAVGGRDVVVDDSERLFVCPNLAPGHPEALEGLRARDLVDEVAVNIKEARSVRRLLNHVIFEDFIVQRLCHDFRKPLGNGG